MKDKRRSVSIKVDEDFYRMMEKVRLQFKIKYGIKINSQQKLTRVWSKNPSIFSDKKWIKELKDLK